MAEKFLLLMIMFAIHIYYDFNLQGVLADLKCKFFWDSYFNKMGIKELPKMYRKDYIYALGAHGFLWSVFTSAPALYYLWQHQTNEIILIAYMVMILLQAVLHAYVDNAKANKMSINLWEDQIAHIAQIITLWYTALHYIG